MRPHEIKEMKTKSGVKHPISSVQAQLYLSYTAPLRGSLHPL